ncbi:MAG: hypothetical protein R2698_08105 [Microthrixaceae bacterium]
MTAGSGRPAVRSLVPLLGAVGPLARVLSQGGPWWPSTLVAVVWVSAAWVAVGVRPPRWPPRLPRRVPLLLAPVVAAQIGWFERPRWRGQVLLGLLASLVLAGELGWPGSGGRVVRAAQRLGRVASDRLARLLAAVGWLAIVMPVWWSGRVAGFTPLGASWQRGSSAWHPVDTLRLRTVADDARDPDRLGASGSTVVPRRLRWARRRSTAVLVMVSAAVIAVVGAVVGADGSGRPAVSVSDSPGSHVLPDDGYGHDDEPWFADYLEEIDEGTRAGRLDLILGFRPTGYAGTMVNVADGRRVTYEPADPQLTVWYFGGSAMFGVGQRDEATIPSVVTKSSEADGIRIRSLNFGVVTDVNWVETIRFAEAIQTPLQRPDLVVFYDGRNDWKLAMQRIGSGATDRDHLERMPVSEEERQEVQYPGDGETGPGNRALADIARLAATQYGRGVSVARAIAGRLGIPVVHFWQPVLQSKRLSPADQARARLAYARRGSTVVSYRPICRVNSTAGPSPCSSTTPIRTSVAHDVWPRRCTDR